MIATDHGLVFDTVVERLTESEVNELVKRTDVEVVVMDWVSDELLEVVYKVYR